MDRFEQLDRIFKEYDIRGIFGEELTLAAAESIGLAFGTYLRRRGETKAVVGRDCRESSPALAETVVRALRSAGVDVVDIGVVITPAFYFATLSLGIGAGVMVTASHNPANYNGFKVQYGGRTLHGAELGEIKDTILSGAFERGSGGYESRPITGEYVDMVAGKIKLGPRRLKVAVDAGNGTAGLFAPAVLEKLGCEVIPLFCDPDPRFPNHFPDPTRPENMEALGKLVRESGADVGVGFDGDGDRLGAVDETGKIIWGDRLMVLFWREILQKRPGLDAIVEVKCSDVLVDEIKKLGGRPFFYKTGHSLIKAKMKEIGAVFTGEMSGHMFFADEYYGYDDAVYAAGRLLRILSNADRPLSALLSHLPETYASPEIRVLCDYKDKPAYIKKARAALERHAVEIVDVDGVRARFADGWGLVRASNTGPELIVRYEGKTVEAFERIKSLMAEALFPLEVG